MAAVDIGEIDAACVRTVVERAVVNRNRSLERHRVFDARTGMEIDHTPCAVYAATEGAVADEKGLYLLCGGRCRYSAGCVGGGPAHEEETAVHRDLIDIRLGAGSVVGTNEIARAAGKAAIFYRDVVQRGTRYHTDGLATTLHGDSLKGKVVLNLKAA